QAPCELGAVGPADDLDSLRRVDRRRREIGEIENEAGVSREDSEAPPLGEGDALLLAFLDSRLELRGAAPACPGRDLCIESRADALPSLLRENGQEGLGGLWASVTDPGRDCADRLSVEHRQEIGGLDLHRFELAYLPQGDRLLRHDLVVDRERDLLVGVVRAGSNLQHAATICGTYGGDQVSTWSILRLSCKPRSPVGLVKQPGTNASAKNQNALALAA